MLTRARALREGFGARALREGFALRSFEIKDITSRSSSCSLLIVPDTHWNRGLGFRV